ncbi:MAG: adenylate/guanylate cyclase domain-containing protein [Pseudomonadota bacterium]|nr:adenylate/guanylate cyclase domain-containing protein [Pseudomonadota bacterium]
MPRLALQRESEQCGPAVEITSLQEQRTEPALRRNSRSNLDRLLREMVERPEAQDELAAEVHAQFSEIRAVMVLDMSGFSRTTQRCGIVAFLLMIHQMKLLTRPAVESNGGLIVKSEADNLYCLFETVDGAVKASREIVQRLETVNLLLPDERRLYAAIGIGYGSILNVDEEDLFGDEVNLASKLGEDVAERGQILLTTAAQAEAAAAGVMTRPGMISISGLSLEYHSVA